MAHVLSLIIAVTLAPDAGVSEEAPATPLPSTEASASGGFDVDTLDLDALLNVPLTAATRTEERVDDVPGAITVITRRQIEDLEAATLRDALSVYVPGMDVVPTYFRSGDRVNEGIYSRGLLSDFGQQVLVLVNGDVKLNESTLGSPLPSLEITLENIERIEVSRSPVPLQGGAALTVINLVTRDLKFKGVESRVRLGADPEFVEAGLRQVRASTLAGAMIGDWHVGGSLVFNQDRGQKQAVPAGFEENFERGLLLRTGTRASVQGSLSVSSPKETLVLQAQARHTSRDAFLSELTATPSTDLFGERATVASLLAKWKPVVGFEVAAGVSLMRWGSRVSLFNQPIGGEVSNHDVFLSAQYARSVEFFGTHQIVAGVKAEAEGQHDAVAFVFNGSGFVEDRNPALVFAPNQTRGVFSVFAEDRWKPVKWLTVVVGGRVDGFTGFGRPSVAVSPRAGVSWTPNDHFSLKGLFSSAIRPPSLYERFGTSRVPLRGSLDVNNERIQSFELAAVLRFEQLRARLSGYYNRLFDRIEYAPTPSGFNIAQNTGSTEVLGLEAELSFYFNARNYLFLNGAWVVSQNGEPKSATPFLPSLYLNGGLNAQYGKVRGSISCFVRGSRPLPVGLEANAFAAGPQVGLNAVVAWAPLEALEAYLSVDNALNLDNRVPLAASGLSVPLGNRVFSLGVTHRL